MSIARLCAAYGITRQAYYQERRRRSQEAVTHTRILDLVRLVRRRHPRMGTRKLLVVLQPQLAQAGLHIGQLMSTRLAPKLQYYFTNSPESGSIQKMTATQAAT